MAHECPECDQLCYCKGDIDDCCHNFPKDQARCTHCWCGKCMSFHEKDGDCDAETNEPYLD